ncbi:MAG: S-layer homology domain-containing protein [Bryobacterales bacterium]|nr:S-layer homology domain-containing protein [Bryobacterales bacterium]
MPLPTFTDAPLGNTYYYDTHVMKEYGITSGCTGSTFCVGDPVTRWQAATFIIRALYTALRNKRDGFDVSGPFPFTDMNGYSTDVRRYAQRMKDLGITGGCTSTTFCPEDSVTHGQMAVFIARARAIVLNANQAGSDTGGLGTEPNPYSPTPYFNDVNSTHGFFGFIQRVRDLGIVVGPDLQFTGCAAGNYCPEQAANRGLVSKFIVRGILRDFGY